MLRTFARPLLATPFAIDGVQMLRNTDEHADDAKSVAGTLRSILPKNVAGYIPAAPETNVRLVGGTKVVAATMLGLGKAPRVASVALVATHVPTLITRRAFWKTDDESKKKDQRRGLVTDLALLGGLAITSADTAGKPGLAWRAKKALPGKSQQEEMLANAQEQAQGLFDKAKDAANQAGGAISDYVDDHSDDWKQTAVQVRDQVSSYAESFADEAQDVSKKARKKAKKQAKKQAKKFK